VQAIRKRWIVNNNSPAEGPDKQSIKDHSFSMADGIGADTKWEAVVLFNAAPPEEIAPPVDEVEQPVEDGSRNHEPLHLEISSTTESTGIEGDSLGSSPVRQSLLD
jgi:hypothetical protein